MKELLSRFGREDSGQDLVEYALLCALIALAAAVGMQAVANAINTIFKRIAFRFLFDPT